MIMSKRKIWFIIVPVVLFGLLAVFIQAGITVGFEGWAYSETVEDMSPVLTSIMKIITHLGDPISVIVFCLALFIIPKARRHLALPVSVAVILSAGLNVALKNIFTRERPNILRLIAETGYSFPSGHAMINGTLYTMLILMALKLTDSTVKKAVSCGICAAIAFLIGYSRIYLGVHYAGDVIGGWLIGFAVSMSVYIIFHINFKEVFSRERFKK